MAKVYARGVVMEKKQGVEKIGDQTYDTYVLWVRLTDPETRTTSTESIRCSGEYQFNQYYPGDSINLRREAGKFLGVLKHVWVIDR